MSEPVDVPVPAALITDHSVADRAVRLWALLAHSAAGQDTVTASYGQLGARLRDGRGRPCSNDTVRRLLRELEAAGWVAVQHHPGGNGGPGRYALTRRVTHP